MIGTIERYNDIEEGIYQFEQKYLVNNFENLYYFYIYDVNKLFKKDDDKLNNNLQSLYGTQNILKYMTNTLKLTFVDTNSDE